MDRIGENDCGMTKPEGLREEVEMENLAVEMIPDIDSCDSKDPLAAVEYVEDIYSFYRQIEVTSCVSPDYMSNQFDINEKMRAILIDWLIEFNMSVPTPYVFMRRSLSSRRGSTLDVSIGCSRPLSVATSVKLLDVWFLGMNCSQPASSRLASMAFR
ncbi:hypothetical protein B296_00042946 [Ensete ventricosum]|uniref:Cyclin N-terminal domain-containing protein n=1 Tax=Ensete ventricosum TaxID=4639 RepID=A0A426Z8Y4_ENSVE|nr:hypothetical protein B296_00042946 [Ensete ventricosum]